MKFACWFHRWLGIRFVTSLSGRSPAVPLALSVLLLLVLLGTSPKKTEAQEWYLFYYRVFPGLVASGLSDYGWHFDEGPAYQDFGARDYNYPGDDWGPVYLRAVFQQDPWLPVRFRGDFIGGINCMFNVTMEFFDGAYIWVLGGADVHYLHMYPATGDPVFTPWSW